MLAYIGLFAVVLPKDEGDSRIAEADIQIEVLYSFLSNEDYFY